MPASFIGREAESAFLDAYLNGVSAGVSAGAAVLLIEGELGIGKTAARRSYRVLACRPVDPRPSSRLPHSGTSSRVCSKRRCRPSPSRRPKRWGPRSSGTPPKAFPVWSPDGQSIAREVAGG